MVSQTTTLNAVHLPVAALGWSLGFFLAVTFTVCVVFDLIFAPLFNLFAARTA